MNLNEIQPCTVDGVEIINLTPHRLDFGMYTDEGRLLCVTVPPSGIVIRAIPTEEDAGAHDAANFITLTYKPDPYQADMLARLARLFPTAVLVGSRNAAMAYPGLIAGIAPLPEPNGGMKNPHKFIVCMPAYQTA